MDDILGPGQDPLAFSPGSLGSPVSILLLGWPEGPFLPICPPRSLCWAPIGWVWPCGQDLPEALKQGVLRCVADSALALTQVCRPPCGQGWAGGGTVAANRVGVSHPSSTAPPLWAQGSSLPTPLFFQNIPGSDGGVVPNTAPGEGPCKDRLRDPEVPRGDIQGVHEQEAAWEEGEPSRPPTYVSRSWDERHKPPRLAYLLRWGLHSFLPWQALNLHPSYLPPEYLGLQLCTTKPN